MSEEINYTELAENQFYKLKEELLDEDRKCLGGIGKEDYEIDGFKFNIKVDGFWEKSTWFNYVVTDKSGNEISRGRG